MSRKEDQGQSLKDRMIFLQKITLEQAKKKKYHPFMKMSELEEKEDKWFYREWQIVEELAKRQEIIRRYHDDERAGHPEIRETIRQVTEIAYWDILRKDVVQYIQKCSVCQKEKDIRKTGLEELVKRPEDI